MRRDIRPEVFCAVAFHPARDADAREPLVKVDADIGVVFVVAQHNVVVRRIALDHVALENKRFQFG